MKYLYLFTISPVQTFIEQARKTHDLYAGSRILSDLVTYAMETVKKKDSNSYFIFPSIEQNSKPNRFIAVVNSDDMQRFGNDIQKEVNDYFIDTLGKDVIDLNHSSIFQLEDFLKTYWVAEKYNEKGDYPNQIKQLERNLGAVKNIRHFKQLGEQGRKCSLNGEYNVKFYRRNEDEGDIERLYNRKLFQNRGEVKVIESEDFSDIGQKDLNEGEGLCAISMIKRLYKNTEEAFPSTAGIALMDTLKRNEIADSYLDIIKSINRGYVDEQIYYESNTSSEYFKKHGYKGLLKNGNINVFRDNFDKMRRSIKSDNLKLSKYYAILAFDADGMGTKLEKCKHEAEHIKISKYLAGFAAYAKSYIDNNQYGKTVYAGGDDFLGFINLNHLFDVIKHLRHEFDKQVNTDLREELQMTFSAGIAIGHYKTPLSEVLKWARQMEKTAKKVLHKSNDNDKKDAFSIAVLKRSGEIHYTTWRWNRKKEANTIWTTDLFQNLIVLLKKGHLSKKFITNLSSEYEKRLDKDGNWGDKASSFENELNEMLSFELDYFIKRATANDEKAKEAVKGLSDELYKNYNYHLDFELSVQNFLNMLHICEFITRELNPIEDDEEAKQNSEIKETEKA
jgi:CRISPR-associated protein Cmr2